MPDEYTPTPGSYMDRVEKAGGFEAYKAQKEAADAINKIPAEKWKVIRKSVGVLEKIADAGGMTEVLSSISSGLTEQFKLQINALIAPLKNELYASMFALMEALGINTLLQDITNLLTSIVNESFGFWEALITGDLDKYLQDYAEKNRFVIDKIVEIKSDMYDIAVGNKWIQMAMEAKWGLDFDALSAAGTAGGTLSGTFDDIDYDLINKSLGINGYPDTSGDRLVSGTTRKHKVTR
jgi:hypothetical protein